MRRAKAFTLIELLVVISIIGLLIGILLPALGAARKTARRMEGSTQVRGIQQALVVFAQGNSGYYPGLISTGAEETDDNTIPYTSTANDGYSVEARFALMLGRELFPAAFLMSPAENDPLKNAPYDVSLGVANTTFGRHHYSYAMLEIQTAGQRRTEWTDSTNAQAVVVSDRINASGTNTFNAGTLTTYDSIHSNGGWSGSLGFNDNHVEFVNGPELPLKYGSNQLVNNDNLFRNPTANDALLIGRGDGTSASNNIPN